MAGRRGECVSLLQLADPAWVAYFYPLMAVNSPRPLWATSIHHILASFDGSTGTKATHIAAFVFDIV